jgi:glycerophosphoryl diester phosphodiesterase
MRPLLLGHRGSRCSRSVPENTFAAFDLALEHGCDGFEFDVRSTCDGFGVVCHGTKFGGIPISLQAVSRLRGLPSLEAVLERYSTSAFLDIELKESGIEPRLLQLLARQPPKKGFIVSSFLSDVLLKLRRLDEGVPLALICGNRLQLRRWRKLPIETVIAHQSLATRRLLNAVHEAGKTCWVWTVNRSSAMIRLSDWRVDGLISDRTDVLAQTFGG